MTGLTARKVAAGDWAGVLATARTLAEAAQAAAGGATQPGASTPVDSTALIAAINALGDKIVALPAEIDRYADGRKQAS